ncbi:hypothetical protein PsexTeo8_26370 [Pseudomonas extremaustralis]|nr:hypothetical protein [Pseudomonas extremaustralis]
MTELPATSGARRAIGLHTGFVQRRVPDWLHRSTASLPAWPPVMRWRRVSKACRVLPNSRSRCLNRPCRNGSARTSMRCPCRRPAQSRWRGRCCRKRQRGDVGKAQALCANRPGRVERGSVFCAGAGARDVGGDSRAYCPQAPGVHMGRQVGAGQIAQRSGALVASGYRALSQRYPA